MQQLTQKLKNGEMQILEVPPPLIGQGMVLVQNYYSVISPGTEGSTVTSARKSLVGKAKERPQQVKQMIEVLKQQGPVQTYRTVTKKLDSYSPLGYSCAGEVIAVAHDTERFVVGDLVACGGGNYANHAEVIAVPVNLCVKLTEDVNLKNAAYNTLGAIALQGVRQADLRIGESCAVIGLGLIGQLTCLILRAGGIKVVGIDIDKKMAEIALKKCADMAFVRDELGLDKKVDQFTDGVGVDAVIITAATESLDPINFAGRITRKKGKVVIVGNVPTGFDREPFYYKKELELRMSCSYGPGRYDINYEEKGIDYPVGYVRWTENRNMKAFQDLIHSGKIDIDYLTTHVFKLDEASSAYDMILERKEHFLGMLIEYDITKEIENKRISINPKSEIHNPQSVNIAFLGAGSYAMSHLLPNITKDKDVFLKGVMTSSGTSSRTVAEKYGFAFCTANEDDILINKAINTVFIATRHNTHAEYIMKSLKAGKHVFVEKPLCLKEEELNEIKEAYNSQLLPRGMHSSSYSTRQDNHAPCLLMVGFNRRFSPLAQILKERVGNGPMAMIYRINAGHIPNGTWIQDRDIGGGRIIGEVCHFIDFLTFINGSLPDHVFANAIRDPENLEDTLNVSLTFSNGSIGTISYFSNGSKSLFKEYIEVYRAGTTAVLKDFKELEIYGNGRTFKKKLLNQDKGQKKMVRTFIDSIKNGKSSPITFEEIYSVNLSTFKVNESLKTKQNVSIQPFETIMAVDAPSDIYSE